MFVGWAILGVALGAVGSEILRASKPELVEKVENAARRFVDFLCSPKCPLEPADAEASGEACQPDQQADEQAVEEAENT